MTDPSLPEVHTERRLRLLAERFLTAFTDAPIGIGLIGLDERWEEVNPALCRILGRDAGALAGVSPAELTHPDDLIRDRAATAQLLDGAAARYELEKRYRDGEGGWSWVRVTRSVVREVDGTPLHFIEQVQDIGPEHRMREALRQNEARFRALTDNASDLVTIVDPEGRIRYASRSAERVLGRSAEELVGRPLRELVGESDGARLEAALTSDAPAPVETGIRHGDGSWRVLESVFRDATDDPAIAGVVVSSRDVTEMVAARRQLEAYSRELERSNQALQDFAYVASHDLQEPLRKIQAFGDRLMQRYGAALGERGGEYIFHMHAAAVRMQSLIRDLLTYSRLTGPSEAPARIPLGTVVEEVLGDLQDRITATGARVRVGELPAIEADAVQMRQLFQNLIGNALKFGRPDVAPEVRIEAVPLAEEGAVEIRVEDNGIGFGPQHAERIFSPFQRLHGRSEYEGTGMGLAICRRVVANHGGRIVALSEPGTGATFRVVLPLQQRDRMEQV